MSADKHRGVLRRKIILANAPLHGWTGRTDVYDLPAANLFDPTGRIFGARRVSNYRGRHRLYGRILNSADVKKLLRAGKLVSIREGSYPKRYRNRFSPRAGRTKLEAA